MVMAKSIIAVILTDGTKIIPVAFGVLNVFFLQMARMLGQYEWHLKTTSYKRTGRVANDTGTVGAMAWCLVAVRGMVVR